VRLLHFLLHVAFLPEAKFIGRHAERIFRLACQECPSTSVDVRARTRRIVTHLVTESPGRLIGRGFRCSGEMGVVHHHRAADYRHRRLVGLPC
jgi:hypothetical protein